MKAHHPLAPAPGRGYRECVSNDATSLPGQRSRYPRLGSMRLEEFRVHLATIAPGVPCDREVLPGEASPLAAPLDLGRFRLGNRWAVQPMEGWDGTTDGNPGELTLRRWRRFGDSGAKLIWGGEAVAVRFDARANPKQLVIADTTLAGLQQLRQGLLLAHRERFGSTAGLVVGLQLTHSGRFSRPHRKDRAEPRVAFRHPILDARVGVTSAVAVLTDGELDGIVEDFVRASRHAHALGFDFVDIKHCHGYLLHELLGAHTRPGRYGGSFENRTRMLREIVAGLRREAPALEPAVRVSVFDFVPFRPDPAGSQPGEPGPGIPEVSSEATPHRHGFGVCADQGVEPDLAEAKRFLSLLRDLGIRLVNVTAGSPYYNPHLQRPALYPPSDGYAPPEDPLVGVARHLAAARELKRAFPELTIVGSALSYLQDFLPQVAQALVRDGWMDVVGYGRMALSYHDLPADTLERGVVDRKRLCRTFSDCTTAPRNGLVSGCYPLDKFYAALPEGAALRAIKSRRP